MRYINIIILIIIISSCDNPVNNILKDTSKKINENCPMKIDDYTTLKTSSINNNTLTYYYFINKNVITDYNITKSYWSNEQESRLKTFYCLSPEFSVFREYNISVRWKYTDLDGFPFDLFEFSNEICDN